MYYIYRRRTLHIKKTSCSEFLLYSPNPMEKQKKHAQNVCPPKIDVYKKYTPKHKVMEFGTKNPTHQKSTGNNPPNQLVSTQFFLDVLLLEFLFSQFFLDLWWVFPKFSTLKTPQVFGSSFPADLGFFRFSLHRFLDRDQTFQVLKVGVEICIIPATHPKN